MQAKEECFRGALGEAFRDNGEALGLFEVKLRSVSFNKPFRKSQAIAH